MMTAPRHELSGEVHSLGLALGGGGIRGLAHIPVLEELDAMGVRPAAIAGTSMGAIIGSLYASGMSGRDIRDLVEEHSLHPSHGLRDVLDQGSRLIEWATSLVPEMRRGGLLNVDRLLERLMGRVGDLTFEELEIPLYVVATDYWCSRQVVLESGPVLQAVRASMAVPGVFAPVVVSGRVLVDGGLVNNLPYDLLTGWLETVIAVDVTGQRTPGRHKTPSAVDAIMGSLDIMQSAALARKLDLSEPAILITPEIHDVGMLEFSRSQEVLDQSSGAGETLRSRLEALGIRQVR